MKRSAKTASRRQRELAKLQVREYCERCYPELADAEVEVSPCGNFASVAGKKGNGP